MIGPRSPEGPPTPNDRGAMEVEVVQRRCQNPTHDHDTFNA